MIAEVYPLKRQSRTLHAFDYLIPEGMALQRGELVEVPYREQILWGVVKKVKDKPERGITLKTVKARYEGLSLREEELSFFEWLAGDLATSVCTLLLCAIQQPPRREDTKTTATIGWLPVMLPRSEAAHIASVVKSMHGRPRAFIQTPDIRRATAIIMGYLQSPETHKTLILAPTVRDVELIASHLTGMEPCVITGAESATERFRRWERFRASSRGVMIGTRAASLMIDSSLTCVFVVRALDDNYKQPDRNPRFDARSLVWSLHERFRANLFLFDTVPTSSILERFHETEMLPWNATTTAQVIDLNQERVHGTISYQARIAMAGVLQQGGKILCIHNQKGVSKLLLCRSCAHRWRCPDCQTSLTVFSHTLECSRCGHREAVPLRCPSCRGQEFANVGKGNQEVVRELTELFEGKTVRLIDKEHPGPADADITVATTFYHEATYNPFRPDRFGIVVCTNIDIPLYSSEPSALTSLARDLWLWRYVAYSSRAPLLVQTASPELLTTVLNEPLSLAAEEAASRRDYHLPPATRWARITLKEPEEHKARLALEALHKTLTAIPGATVSWKQLHHGVPEALDVGIVVARFSELTDVFSSLPDRYIIDTTLYA